MRNQKSEIESDLDWIVMKCLEKDRARECETANGLAADLKRHLNNEPVVARPPSAAYRFQKAFRRNKLVFAAGTAVAGALVLGAVVSLWQARRALEEGGKARQAQQNESARATEAQRLVRGRTDGFVEVRPLATGAWEVEWRAHGDAMTTIASSRDGAYLATASLAGEVKVWDFASRREQARLDLDDPQPSALAISPDDDAVAVAGASGQIHLWNWRTGQRGQLVGADQNVLGLAFSPDGRRLAATTQQANAALVWDVASTRLVDRQHGHVLLGME